VKSVAADFVFAFGQIDRRSGDGRERLYQNERNIHAVVVDAPLERDLNGLSHVNGGVEVVLIMFCVRDH